jgi:hypothetical protein
VKNKNASEVIPGAKRLIKSLRDIGYDFSTAVADLVDNSIEAGASQVDISVMFDGENSFVRIADNGKGMDALALKEAMRYGSERTYNEEDLGKFGLGLKTASLSQCQCLSIASRTSKSRKNIVSFSWDLAHIEKTDKWEILTPSKKTIEILHNPLSKRPGTVVLWERLDRILGYERPYGEQARKKMNSMCRELEEHLAMVFHKFLAKETPRKQLEIFLNENPIKPWDPFARQEPKTKKLSPIKLVLEDENINGELILQPYILPSQEEFTSLQAFNNSAGPGNWNQQQGFYIYRANRMIQSGGWCRLRTPDEHTKLSRIELSFSPKYDNAFKVNVAKMRVQLPLQLRDTIELAIGPAVRLAREHYDRKRNPQFQSSIPSPNSLLPSRTGTNQEDSTLNLNDLSAAKIESHEGTETPRLFTFEEIEKEISDITTGKEKKLIINIFQRLRKKLFRGKSK